MPPTPSKSHSTLYGIKNCDTIKKARKWLESKGVDHVYHDFRDDGLEDKTIAAWLSLSPPCSLINKRSTTWKQLSEKDKASLEAIISDNEHLGGLSKTQSSLLLKLLTANPTLIKRPVLVLKKGSKLNQIEVGFSDKRYAEVLG